MRISPKTFAGALGLRLVGSSLGESQASIGVPELGRPGLQFAGYFDVFACERPQLIGLAEMAYLKSLDAETMEERMKREGPAPAHERTVLLAPSWGKSALFGVYGAKIIDVLLETGYHIIIRPHPQSFTSEKEMIEGLMAAYPDSDRIEWNRDRDNFDVLRRSDILVSDFSGVIFEFTLIYDKPVIYTDPDFDLAPYDAWWLKDRTLWTVSALPRLGRELTEENMENIKALIDECIEDTRFAEGRKEVKAETWEHTSRGAQLAADYICEKCDELLSGQKSDELPNGKGDEQ